MLAQVLLPPAHMAALDISEAYTHIPICRNLHRYLAFSFHNQLYFFRALPFGTIHFYQGHGLASPYPPHPGDQYSGLPGRYCPLAPLPRHSPTTRSSHDREALGHGVSAQPPEVTAGTPNDPPVAGHPLAPADRTLAGVPTHSGQDPVVYPPAPSARPHHPQALGGSGGSHKLRLPGAQPLEGLSPASDSRGVPRFSPGQRRLSTHPSDTPPGLTVLGGSQHLGLRPTLPGDSSPSVPLDGRLSLGMGRISPSSSHRSRPLGTSGDSLTHKCARASGGQPGHHSFQPVVLPPCRVYGQRDGSVCVNAPAYSLPPVTGGTERSFTRHGQATGVCSPAPHPHHSQCGSRRPEPARTTQHGVDAASRGLPSDPSLGRSPSSPLGTHTRPGCHFSSSRLKTTYTCGDAIPTLRTRPGLPQVGDLRAMNRIYFLHRALLTSRPAAVVDTLLASYRPSSQRQQEVAWTAFHHWLPLDCSAVTKDDVLAFLQDLFSTKSVAPRTILNYRAAFGGGLLGRFFSSRFFPFCHRAFSPSSSRPS